MALITRLSRLFRADIHAVLDHMEEPDVLLRQAVREMEESLEHSARETAFLQRELNRLEKHRAALTDQLEKLDSEIAVCFDSGNEELAKTFIRRRLEAATLQKNVTANIERVNEQFIAQQKQHAEQQLSYESIKQKSELIWREQQLRNKRTFNGATGNNGATGSYSTIGSVDCSPIIMEDDVELEFIRQKERFVNATQKNKRELSQ